MSEEQRQALIEAAKKWMKQSHIGRTGEELEAFLVGVEEALIAVYGDTGHGVYPAHVARYEIEEVFYPDEPNK